MAQERKKMSELYADMHIVNVPLPMPLAKRVRMTGAYHKRSWRSMMTEALKMLLEQMKDRGEYVAPYAED